MPTYAYRCESCEHQEDVWQKISEPHLTRCPSCAQDTFRRQLTAANFQLKGSGWYVTDFRDGNKSDKSSSETKKPEQVKPAQVSSDTTASVPSASVNNNADTAAKQSTSAASTPNTGGQSTNNSTPVAGGS